MYYARKVVNKLQNDMGYESIFGIVLTDKEINICYDLLGEFSYYLDNPSEFIKWFTEKGYKLLSEKNELEEENLLVRGRTRDAASNLLIYLDSLRKNIDPNPCEKEVERYSDICMAIGKVEQAIELINEAYK